MGQRDRGGEVVLRVKGLEGEGIGGDIMDGKD